MSWDFIGFVCCSNHDFIHFKEKKNSLFLKIQSAFLELKCKNNIFSWDRMIKPSFKNEEMYIILHVPWVKNRKSWTQTRAYISARLWYEQKPWGGGLYWSTKESHLEVPWYFAQKKKKWKLVRAFTFDSKWEQVEKKMFGKLF